MLQSDGFVDILATLLLGCLGLLGWIHFNEKHSFNPEIRVAIESQLPNDYSTSIIDN